MIRRSLKLVLTTGLLAIFALPVQGKEYLQNSNSSKWGLSSAVVTQGGKTVWISGQIGLTDEQGQSQAGNFEGQARVIFRAIDRIAKEAGGSIKDVVNITVYLTDPWLLEPLQPIRREFWPDGKFPASTTITVHSLPFVGMMLEVSAVANIETK
jgi:2-iminobutanoate/2-iminopropanoate deaminase